MNHSGSRLRAIASTALGWALPSWLALACVDEHAGDLSEPEVALGRRDGARTSAPPPAAKLAGIEAIGVYSGSASPPGAEPGAFEIAAFDLSTINQRVRRSDGAARDRRGLRRLLGLRAPAQRRRRAQDSPIGEPLLIVANELSRTVRIHRLVSDAHVAVARGLRVPPARPTAD